MDGLLVNPVTKGQLAHIAKKPPHAVLLTGPAGSGKQTLAVQTGATLLGIDAVKLEKYPYYRFIEPQKGTIAIELIRQLQRFLQLRTPGRAAVRAVGEAGRRRRAVRQRRPGRNGHRRQPPARQPARGRTARLLA